MKKVDSLKNSGVNVMVDNAGEKKKILDGCKFCMEKRGCKCDKAEELFDQPSVLSPYSPDNWIKYSAFVSEKPLDFPLNCYEYGPELLRYCESCQIVYETRGVIETCSHCGKTGIPISDLYQAAYGPYLEKDYYYTGFYTPCPYEKGLGCTNAYTENCGKDCFYHPFHIHCSETEEAYDILARYYEEFEVEHKELESITFYEMREIIYAIAVKEELDRCYDEMAGCFIEDKEDFERLCMYYKDASLYDIEDVRKLTNIVYVNQPHMSKNEIMVALDLVESIFCGNQHPTNEENYQRDVEFFRSYEADDAYRLTPCYGNCDSMCELCPINGHEKEYVFDNIGGRLNYIKESLKHERSYLRGLYMELLDITLILNQVSGDRLDKFVNFIREACIRMDGNEVDACVEFVVSLFETTKSLAKVDPSYMKAKD